MYRSIGRGRGTGSSAENGYENGRVEVAEGRPVRVLLADDHTMFRQGLATLLSSYGGMEVVGQTTNDEGAVDPAQKARPNVVVMQVRQPMERSREFLRRMTLIEPSPKVVSCTMFEDPGYVRAFLGMGASAYLVKSASSGHPVGALRDAVFDPRGRTWSWACAMLEEAKGGLGGALSGESWSSSASSRADSPTARSREPSTSRSRR